MAKDDEREAQRADARKKLALATEAAQKRLEQQRRDAIRAVEEHARLIQSAESEKHRISLEHEHQQAQEGEAQRALKALAHQLAKLKSKGGEFSIDEERIKTLMAPRGEHDGEPELHILIDPGDARPDRIAALLVALSELQEAAGGLGLQFRRQGQVAFKVEGATR